jgi:hypothetical protein
VLRSSQVIFMPLIVLGSLGAMHPQVQPILSQLQAVEAQRRLRAADPALAARVQAVKQYQHGRFERSYADLLASPRYRQASNFFLEELYGPSDFSRRDAQFARVIPALVRLFPKEVVHTVQTLAELHALSEALDTDMARSVAPGTIDAASYRAAWQAVGRPEDREAQIRLTRRVGDALDAYTRNPLLRHSLRLMRTPARLAGLAELQTFLELGFDTFKAIKGAREFLDTVVERESAFAAGQFGSG